MSGGEGLDLFLRQCAEYHTRLSALLSQDRRKVAFMCGVVLRQLRRYREQAGLDGDFDLDDPRAGDQILMDAMLDVFEDLRLAAVSGP